MNHNIPRIDGIYETHLTVADLDRSITFYRDILGLELARKFDDRRIAFFWVGDKMKGMIGLWETGSGPMRMRLHLAFRMEVEEVLASAAFLASRGVQPLGFRGDPVSEAEVIGWMPALTQYFADPDGHSIEFIAVLDEVADQTFGVGPYSNWLAR
jgi:lactoylglutathione lyase